MSIQSIIFVTQPRVTGIPKEAQHCHNTHWKTACVVVRNKGNNDCRDEDDAHGLVGVETDKQTVIVRGFRGTKYLIGGKHTFKRNVKEKGREISRGGGRREWKAQVVEHRECLLGVPPPGWTIFTICFLLKPLFPFPFNFLLSSLSLWNFAYKSLFFTFPPGPMKHILVEAHNLKRWWTDHCFFVCRKKKNKAKTCPCASYLRNTTMSLGVDVLDAPAEQVR